MNFDTAGGRRFLLTVGVFMAACVLLWFGKIDARTWADVLNWTVTAYIAGNVAQRVADARAPKP